jgi:hypothetical protein
MYIFELLFDYLKGKKYTPKNKYNPLNSSTEDLIENPDECEHLFMPLDSSNEMFACKYCGLVVSKEKLKQNK